MLLIPPYLLQRTQRFEYVVDTSYIVRPSIITCRCNLVLILQGYTISPLYPLSLIAFSSGRFFKFKGKMLIWGILSHRQHPLKKYMSLVLITIPISYQNQILLNVEVYHFLFTSFYKWTRFLNPKVCFIENHKTSFVCVSFQWSTKLDPFKIKFNK